MKIQFNTRRQYTAEGQRIVAILDPVSEQIAFWDHDRGVDGIFPSMWVGEYEPTEAEIKEEVMFAYDRGLSRPLFGKDFGGKRLNDWNVIHEMFKWEAQ
jgi:hypothetical protein